MQAIPTKLLFVINPISGGVDKDETETSIQTFCREKGIQCNIYHTTGEADDLQIISICGQDKPDAVVAVGGDGTVNLVGTMLINKNIPLGIIPQGSGNGLSKDLKIPQDFAEAMDVLGKFNKSYIDTLSINGIPSLHLSDVGFNALIVKRFSEGDRRGPGAYAWNLMKEYVGYQPKEYEVVTDKDHFRGKAFMVTIANANMFGSNATINPDGEVDDGFFEICVLTDFPKTEGINILYQMYRADINNSPYSNVFKCRYATILNLEKELIQIDGEPVDTVDKLEVKILPRSLQVIMP
jgi:YegS/Rv2252/BmrU family lipid kinase